MRGGVCSTPFGASSDNPLVQGRCEMGSTNVHKLIVTCARNKGEPLARYVFQWFLIWETLQQYFFSTLVFSIAVLPMAQCILKCMKEKFAFLFLDNFMVKKVLSHSATHVVIQCRHSPSQRYPRQVPSHFSSSQAANRFSSSQPG